MSEDELFKQAICDYLREITTSLQHSGFRRIDMENLDRIADALEVIAGIKEVKDVKKE